MKITDIITVIRSRNLWTLNQITRDMQTVIRMQFLYAAIESGLLTALRTPATRSDLLHRLAVQRPDILDALLEVGCALHELACQHGRYTLIGTRARALVGPDGETLAALIQASTTYYHSVYQHATERLHGAPSGDYLAEIGDIVARIGIITEPFVQAFIRDIVAGPGPLRLLDSGCGSGIALRTAQAANPQVTGIGIERDRNVAQQTRTNLERWGLSHHFAVLVADIRWPPATVQGQFDVILMSNIIYYFPRDERLALFQSLRAMLAPGGVLALVSNMQSQGMDIIAANLNMATSSMRGCTPLPGLDDLHDQMTASGFAHIQTTRLIPSSAFFGITAR